MKSIEESGNPFMVLRGLKHGNKFYTLNGDYRKDWYEKLFEGTDRECVDFLGYKNETN